MNGGAPVNSCIYEGVVSHCRFFPREHRFSYRVFMLYIDLDELEGLFSRNLFWSVNRSNLGCFRREDYLGEPAIPLAQAVQERVREETGEKLTGPVRMLTNLRYFGFIINPITTYYCFDENGSLRYKVAEVTNTPWGERHSYVISASANAGATHACFSKQHHVSPFMPMHMDYTWRSSPPGKRLKVYMENHERGSLIFNASMTLKSRKLTPTTLNGFLIRYPFMTLKVAWGIYWQALRLCWKKIPFHPHPKKLFEKNSGKGLPNRIIEQEEQ